MGKVSIFENLTLDGVMQAPGHPDEDRRGGFQHGGWATRYSDEVMGKFAGERMSNGGGTLLLGRWTYEKFAMIWPSMPEDNPFTKVMNESEKLVASRTLKEPLEWNNSTLLGDDVPGAVARLKEKGKSMTVLGSGELVRALMEHNLIDEFVLQIHPLILGTGLRLFTDDSATTAMRLVDSRTTTKGVVIAVYTPA